ncbi:Gp37-like protein [Oceanobacillus kimchii]|uniref:Gp28/Gp37-like domain-containing protein n=1 Tax=Oceanobacillus kimchii TaxID=746691 RepID=A0ABQ5TEF0_9BACI|nr:hypothetical protein [Oceanobacillus kimchii]GLO64760.1 hypothetical protein MACH08_05440 [Oceanobacillus kimchii]
MQPIRVYSTDLQLLTETDNYLSLQFTPRFYDVGDFELHINQYMEGAEHFQKGNFIVLDKQGDKAMVIRHREVSLDSNGKASETWKITGVTLDGILNQRVTIPPDHTSHDRKKGNAEVVMKHYVEKHFVNPDNPDRKIDFLEIAPNQNRGPQVDWESRFRNVGDEITSISKQANIGWMIYADMERRKFIFDVAEQRNVTQDNPTGLQPVFFSPDYQTIKSQQFVDSNNNYRNVGYVGGQGEGEERKIVKVGDAKGVDLYEVFIDARDIGETLENEDGEEIELSPEEEEARLRERGEQKMKEFETTFYLEAQILTPSIRETTNDFAMSTPFEYEVDFRLGDIVQVFNKTWNITMNAPITEIKEIHEPGGFILEATFGEAQATLIKKISDKFNEIQGIENQELPVKISVEKMKEAIDFADERISDEERKRIEQAQQNLQESKSHADEQSYQAEQEAKRHADNQDVYYDDIAKSDAANKSNNAEENAKNHAEEKDRIVEENARQDATEKANQSEDNSKQFAEQKANEAENNSRNYTDGSFQELDTIVTEARQEINQAISRVEESEQIIQEAKTDVEGAIVRLDDFEISLGDKLDIGKAVDDINNSDTRILGKNITLDGNALIRGSLGAEDATFLDMTTRNMTAINAIMQDSVITGTLDANNAVFQKGTFDDAIIVNANIQDAVITGRLEGVTGNYAGKLSSLIREDTIWTEDDYFVAEIDRGSVRTLSWERDPNFPLAITSYLGGSLQFNAYNNSANFNPNNLNDPNINNARFLTKIVNYTTDGMRVRKADPSRYGESEPGWFLNNEGYLHIEDTTTNLFSRKRLQLFSNEGVYIYQGTSSQGNIYIGTGVWTSDRVHIAGGMTVDRNGITGSLNVEDSISLGGRIDAPLGLRTSEGSADIIVEQGSNSNGNYIRYANGIQICWNHISTRSVSTSTHTEQGLTFYRGGPSIDFAIPFIEEPAINYDGDVDGGSWRAVMKRAWSVTTTGFGAQFMGLSSFSTVDRLSYIAIGRWK